MSTTLLFQKAKQQYSVEEIAKNLHLHKGTVKRWVQEDKVPSNYHQDFLRLLGISINDEGNARDKDQFYTKPKIAKDCFKKFKEIAKELKIDIKKYHYIEPSAGCGCFYDILPKNKIGIDIDPRKSYIIKSDYLQWRPEKNQKYIVIGNPPFGLRGNKALQFINHSNQFADMVAFILPQLFESDGKGSTMKRVHPNYTLAYSQKIPDNSFYYPDGTDVNIATIFQVWTKINKDKINHTNKKSCDEYIKVYSLSDGGTPASTRNKKMIGKCDIYLPSTTYKKVEAFKSFNQLPHKRGYGIVIKKNKPEIIKILSKHNWEKTAFRSTNSALNLRTSLIKNVIVDSGYFDKNPQTYQPHLAHL